MNWDVVSPDQTSYIVNVDAMTTGGSGTVSTGLTWRFGVALVAGQLSGGIVWGTCSFAENGES